jgi:hypothetical protein
MSWSNIKLREQAAYIEKVAEIFKAQGVPEPNISRAGLTWVWYDPQNSNSVRVTFDHPGRALMAGQINAQPIKQELKTQEDLQRIAEFVYVTFAVVGRPTIKQGPPRDVAPAGKPTMSVSAPKPETLKASDVAKVKVLRDKNG